jgi:multidrug efflux pump subunit AcrA (membrane-fusion protein)
VYVRTAAEEFIAHDVRLGRRDGRWFAVEQGLEEGDLVVTAGVYHLRWAAGGR